MPRKQRCRRICKEPEYNSFGPDDVTCDMCIVLSIDEFEVIRLVDYEKKTHEQCAMQMDISRTTVTEIYESARFKISDCIINGKKLVIEGGNYSLCDGSLENICGMKCRRKHIVRSNMLRTAEGEYNMIVAVTYENGNIFQHFGHTEQFKMYNIENGVITEKKVIDTNGQGHGALAGFLNGNKVDILICGGIGGGAKTALADAGIKLYGGVTGSADEAVKSLIEGQLQFDSDVHCSHHDNEDSEHTCGEHCCH